MDKIGKLKSTPWRRPGKTALLCALMLAGLFLSACATAPESAGNSIAERAQDRWDALLAGNFETAYGFYSPGYRSSTSMFDLAFEIRSRRVRWTSAQYKEHRCAENSCTVLFDVGYTVNIPVPGVNKWDGKDVLEEKWVKTDGQWWFLPKK